MPAAECSTDGWNRCGRRGGDTGGGGDADVGAGDGRRGRDAGSGGSTGIHPQQLQRGLL